MLDDTTTFTTLTGKTWVEPVLPVFGAHDELTLPHIYSELERYFAKDSRQWNTFNNLTRAIHTQLVEAIADEHICNLHHEYSDTPPSLPSTFWIMSLTTTLP